MDLPVLPPIAPMLAKAVPGIPAADSRPGGFVYEPKWDGFRCVVFRDGDEVLLASRSGKPLDRYFPDVVDAVRDALPQRCVVDGEIVVAQGARLEFELLQQRVHPAASRVARLAAETPAALVVFDVLALGDDDVSGQPLERRHDALDALALRGPLVFTTPRTRDAAVAQQWFESFEGAGLDGVVAKPLDLPYQPGKRSMLKIKHERTADVVLAGYRPHKDSTPDEPRVGSLLLGLHDAHGQLRFVGAASSFTAVRRAQLAAELAPGVVVEDHPWIDQDGEQVPGAPSRWTGSKDTSFVALRPERVLEVAYDHMEGPRFRHTVQMRRWREDREPESCTYEQLDEPVSYDLAELLPGAPGSEGRG
ncbi:ATP-dependent DNA ligase [Sediminihabitans luteus]|uniref:DNA ligase (ATP) n=1 Tax=Sediminihabitans luteus TaxID=1138585 RepID=A0A2M9CQG0_9CELL|nr:ATP-dependent DNA ligase [Sediminihabitans luteus]PJJ74163.1 ATP-dependent DNA ligase [Sediminihabitans luteus]GII99016.1 ATP-dependent DNA ligase [Sediminihabitans luteus]